MLFYWWPLSTRRRNQNVYPLYNACTKNAVASAGHYLLSLESWILFCGSGIQPTIFHKTVKLLAILDLCWGSLIFVSGFPFGSQNNPSRGATGTMEVIDLAPLQLQHNAKALLRHLSCFLRTPSWNVSIAAIRFQAFQVGSSLLMRL